MKRQNSTTSQDDSNNDDSTNNSIVYPLELSSPTIMTTPPYYRSGSHGGGRRRKVLYSNNNSSNGAAESNNREQPSSSSLISSTTIVGSAITSNSQPNHHHDTRNNNMNIIATQIINPADNINSQQQQEEDKDTSKKLRPHNVNNALSVTILLTSLYHKLMTKIHYYRNKLSKLSPRQKCLMCTALIAWKFIQAWLIVRGVVYLSGTGTGSNNEGKSVVQVGQSMEQRLTLEEELKVEIEWSKVEEGRLEERLWMKEEEEEVNVEKEEEGDDDDGGGQRKRQQQRQFGQVQEEGGRSGESNNNDGVEEWIIEERRSDEGAIMATRRRILYMLTVTCPTPQQQQQQRQDSTTITNVNENNIRNLHSSSHNSDTTTTTNMDSILSTLSTNIQTMITHPEGYAVDVYWILGCAWSDYHLDKSSLSLDDVGKKEMDVSEYWNEYIARQLPDGVGLQVWEDAMPLDYSFNVSHDDDVRQTIQKRRLEKESKAAAVVLPKDQTTERQQQQQQQQRQTFQSDAKSKTSTKKEAGDQTTIPLSPSIDKFMKQHRYVVRDKLDYYDVFLSFGASLQQQNNPQSSSSITRPSGELVQVNGTSVEFCSKNLYKDTKISCSDRVEYLKNRYGNSESVAKVSLLKQKECICSTNDVVGGDDLEAVIPSQSLERITGDHVHTFLSMSSELKELPNGQHIIPGFVSVDTVPSAAAPKSVNTSGSQQFPVDASPCCGSDSVELTVEAKGGAPINTDEWQMMQVENTDSADGSKDKTKAEAQSVGWIAVEEKSAVAAINPAFKFYQDGWILTKEQLLRLDYGSHRGKFLPPFANDNAMDNINSRRQGLASPLFDSTDEGGLGLRRAISLDPNRFSRQLVRYPVPLPISKSVGVGVKELLRQFHNAKGKM